MIINVIHKPIECRLIADNDFSPEDCKALLDTDLSDLIKIMTIPITNEGSLKIEAFKLGFKWIKENHWVDFFKDEIKIVKISWLGKWAQINPNLKEFNKEINNAVFNLLNLIPDNFSILLGNNPIKIKQLKIL